jgi:hypothetical protein
MSIEALWLEWGRSLIGQPTLIAAIAISPEDSTWMPSLPTIGSRKTGRCGFWQPVS